MLFGKEEEEEEADAEKNSANNGNVTVSMANIPNYSVGHFIIHTHTHMRHLITVLHESRSIYLVKHNTHGATNCYFSYIRLISS